MRGAVWPIRQRLERLSARLVTTLLWTWSFSKATMLHVLLVVFVLTVFEPINFILGFECRWFGLGLTMSALSLKFLHTFDPRCYTLYHRGPVSQRW